MWDAHHLNGYMKNAPIALKWLLTRSIKSNKSVKISLKNIVFISKKTGLGVRTLIKYSPTDSLKLASGSENRVGHVSIVFYGVCVLWCMWCTVYEDSALF